MERNRILAGWHAIPEGGMGMLRYIEVYSCYAPAG